MDGNLGMTLWYMIVLNTATRWICGWSEAQLRKFLVTVLFVSVAAVLAIQRTWPEFYVNVRKTRR